MIDQHPKYFVRRRMKTKHKIDLNETQLQEIDDIYLESKKEGLLNLYYYRFINMSFAIFVIVIWFLIRGTVVEKPFFLISTISFGFVNILQAIRLRIRLKRLDG